MSEIREQGQLVHVDRGFGEIMPESHGNPLPKLMYDNSCVHIPASAFSIRAPLKNGGVFGVEPESQKADILPCGLSVQKWARQLAKGSTRCIGCRQWLTSSTISRYPR